MERLFYNTLLVNWFEILTILESTDLSPCRVHFSSNKLAYWQSRARENWNLVAARLRDYGLKKCCEVSRIFWPTGCILQLCMALLIPAPTARSCLSTVNFKQFLGNAGQVWNCIHH